MRWQRPEWVPWHDPCLTKAVEHGGGNVTISSIGHANSSSTIEKYMEESAPELLQDRLDELIELYEIPKDVREIVSNSLIVRAHDARDSSFVIYKESQD